MLVHVQSCKIIKNLRVSHEPISGPPQEWCVYYISNNIYLTYLFKNVHWFCMTVISLDESFKLKLLALSLHKNNTFSEL